MESEKLRAWHFGFAALKSLSRKPLGIHSRPDRARMNGAACVTRTRDPIITNDVLYRLS